jgi:hypothetical protein
MEPAPDSTNHNDQTMLLTRWRLILGGDAEDGLGQALAGVDLQRDQALDFLYGREYGPGRNVRGGGKQRAAERDGGLGESQPTVPEWINHVYQLFPKRTIERLEKDALERYQLTEMVTNPETLARVEPSLPLLKAVLQTKHLMNQQVLGMARELVRKMVDELLKRLAQPVQSVFLGARDRKRRSFIKSANNFDPKTTVRRNLSQFDPQTQRLYIREPIFSSRVRRHCDRWQLILLVDESGSMIDSVIYSAVTASIFWGIRALKTHLVLFDTNVVDVTADCTDPVETLMKVQLGGGTDIGQALEYAAGLVENPRRTIIVLITDFYEGAPVDRLLSVTKRLIESGVNLLGLAALDEQADPCYDRDLAKQIVQLGAHVGAMTPGELAEWVAAKVR